MNLDALTTVQHQVAHRHQLLRAGVSASSIQRRLQSGEWQRLLPAVYALFADDLRYQHRVVGALLYAGADAQLAGATALRLHGLVGAPPDERVHLLVPHHRQLVSADFAVLHRTCRLTVPSRVGRLPLCPVARAIADTARWGAEPAQLRVLVAEAVERRLTTVDGLRAEMAGARRNSTAGLRAALAELTGVSSAPDADLRVSLLQSRLLPEIVWNPTLRGPDGRRLPGPDAWIPDAAIGLEVDAGTDPPPAVEWERTAARHGLMAGYGALVLQFPHSRLRRDPHGVRRAVERAYLQRRGCGHSAGIRVG